MLDQATRWRRWELVFSGGALAFVIAVLLWPILRPRAPSLRDRLISDGAFRPTPGRLLGEYAWRPWRPRKKEEPLDGKVAQALDNLSASGNRFHLDTALIHLTLGDTTTAIAGFELAAREQALAPEALADLSAAYLARFAAEGDTLDLLRAVQAADRGLKLDSGNATIRFNRGTALSLLGARILARAAWRDVEAREQDGWREEALARLRELDHASADEEWARFVPRIMSPVTSPMEIEALAERMPARARAFGEEVLLVRWADRTARGDILDAEHALRVAASIGSALRRSRGEELLADAVMSIRRTMNGGSQTQRDELVRGVREFGAGVAQYNEQNLTTAQDSLTKCAADLALAGNPLRFWARFYIAIGEYYSNADRGLALFNALLGEISPGRYPALAGRIDWMCGTVDKVQGRIQSSVLRYERAAKYLRQAGGEPAAAFVFVLLAESYTGLGEHSMAWENRRIAFREVPYSEGPRRNIAMWTEAKDALLHQGSLALAGPLVEEAAAYAEQWGRPLGRASAYLDRAAYRLETGSRTDAFTDVTRAKTAIAQMEPSALREQMTNLALITEGLCYRTNEPVRAAALLREGLERQHESGTHFDAITYTTALAAAQVSSGDTEAGTASLERVLRMFEEIRATVEDPVSRMQAFRQAQPAFDQLIALRAATAPDDHETPFLLAERSRARVLLDLREPNRGVPATDGFARLRDLEQALPEHTALASYVVLDDRIFAWVVEDGHSRQLTLPSRRGDLVALIDRFRLEMSGSSGATTIRNVAALLYDVLIRPLQLSAGANRTLIIVPDRWLARLPFPALFDRDSGHYLIEQRAVAIAPSATLLMRAASHGANDERAVTNALVLGVSRGGTYRGLTLPFLPQVENEAGRIAALYTHAALLRAESATRENFLRMSLSSDMIHFAGHAVVDLEAPRRSVLLFAESSGSALTPLSLGELFDAGIGRPRLVVLSACRAQDSVADDREGLLGLSGAFVAAGVPEVVASPLNVDDDIVAPIMTAFHRHYRAERSAAKAFQEAVADLLRSGPADARSPAAWGGFTVIEGSLRKRGS